MVAASAKSGLPLSERLFIKSKGKCGDHEVRRVRRKLLLETLEKELPKGTVRYSSKVVSIEDSGFFKLVHLADGSVLKAKVLIGSDGVNSVVAKWLGFKKPAFVGRSAIRGFADFKRNHGFDPKFRLFFGNGVRSGFLPCDDNIVNWFFTFTPSTQDKEMLESSAKMKEFVLKKLANVPDRIKTVIELTEIDTIICSPLRIRHPWEILWGNISKGNVCVIGDALHPMTPDIGQGGCAALEDGVILARLLAEALAEKPAGVTKEKAEKEEFERIEMALNKFARERRWRGFELVSTSYMVGYIQQSDGMVMNFLRDKLLAVFLPDLLLKMADFDCGTLKTASATCMN